MCEDGFGGEETGGVVDFCVGGVGGEHFCYEGAFGEVFGDVGLDWDFCGGVEGAEILHAF